MTRRQILEQALAAYGVVDAARIESYLLGCDLNKPVARVLLRAGDRFQVWVRDGGIPGKFGAPIGEDPKRLGIMIDGRHRETFVVRKRLPWSLALQRTSRAAWLIRWEGLAEERNVSCPPIGWRMWSVPHDQTCQRLLGH